eukprot:COSAG06_NODE_30477_length_538_cov_0.938497_1_plen_122_part_01
MLPELKVLVNVSASTNVAMRSLTLAHTDWELTQHGGAPRERTFRDRALETPPPLQAGLGGSGPLPVSTQLISAVAADSLTVSNCTVRNGGAKGLQVAHSRGIAISRSVFFDFGASAIETAVT